eukprot:3770261-Pyramimonas_sp.AAC.1
MSCRAVRHSTRKIIIRSASLQYLDGRSRSATRAGINKNYLYVFEIMMILNLTRAVDELQSCS